jgi:hypothetical protein
MADVDETWVQGLQTRVIKPEFFHGSRFEIFGDDVRRGDQAQHRLSAFRGLKIERQTLLVAVEKREKACPGSQQIASAVTALAVADCLDLDDFGAQVGQDHPAGGAHDHMGKLDDPDAGIGQGLRHQLVHAQRSIANCRNFVRWILVPLALGVVGNASILKIRRGTL